MLKDHIQVYDEAYVNATPLILLAKWKSSIVPERMVKWYSPANCTKTIFW